MNRKIKVGFDISQIAHRGGVATYTKVLASHLQETDLEMVFFYASLRKPYRGTLKGVKSFKIPPTLLEIVFNRTRVFPIENFLGPLDIYHSSDWTQPRTKALKVTTYHDVIALKYPDWSHPKIVRVHKRRLKIVEKEIDLVIAVSETTKQDLMTLSSIPSEKIIVIPEAADENFQPQKQEEVNKFREKYNLPEKFVLAVGGIGDRRNMLRIKEACQGYPLYITGENLPYFSDSEMPLLYASATLLLYPSLYEGFGLPILEAMQTGLPVITSNLSSMPEIGGDAVVYVDPTDPKDIRSAVSKLLEDTKKQSELSKKGLVRAKSFSWQKATEQTVQAYKELYLKNQK